MDKLVISSYDEFAAYLGKNLGVSDYVELTQERINMFADATLDHQWIHVDTERAARESQFGTTIAHGYLTLSMLPYLWNQIIAATMSGVVRLLRAMPEGTRVGSGQALFVISSEHMQNGDPADRARVAYETARSEYERARKLVKDRIISEKEFNTIKENYDIARIEQKALAGAKGKTGVTVASPA